MPVVYISPESRYAHALFTRLYAAERPEVLLDCLMNPEMFIDATAPPGASRAICILASSALGDIKDARAVAPLIARLNDQETDVRSCAVLALGDIGDARAVAPLTTRLKDREISVRGYAAIALGKIGDTRAVAPLIACLKDCSRNDEWVQSHAADALGRIGDARAVEPLIACLNDLDMGVRCHAANALRLIGDERALQPLADCVKRETGKYTEIKATEALESIRSRTTKSQNCAVDRVKHTKRRLWFWPWSPR